MTGNLLRQGASGRIGVTFKGIFIIRSFCSKYFLVNKNKKMSAPKYYIHADGLDEFGEAFCNILNPIYEQNGQKWFSWGHHEECNAIAFAFFYGPPNANVLPNLFDKGLEGIEKLIPNNTRRNMRINRVVRQYLHIDGYDVLILVKPKVMRYWTKSIALRDAGETFTDLKRAGL